MKYDSLLPSKCLFCQNDMNRYISWENCYPCNVRCYMINNILTYYFNVRNLVVCLDNKDFTLFKNNYIIANYNLSDLNWKLTNNKENNLKIFNIIDMILTFQ